MAHELLLLLQGLPWWTLTSILLAVFVLALVALWRGKRLRVGNWFDWEGRP